MAPKSIREEIQQQRPFRSRGHEALVSLLRTADVVRSNLQAVTGRHGITLQQYNVLRILRGAGPGGLATLAIAERMIERVPGITRLLDRLETKQLVMRQRCTEDRRQVLCRITPAGVALLGRLDQPIHAHDHAVLDTLTAAEQKALLGALDRIRAARGPEIPPLTSIRKRRSNEATDRTAIRPARVQRQPGAGR